MVVIAEEEVKVNDAKSQLVSLQEAIGEKENELNELVEKVDRAKRIISDSLKVKKEVDEYIISELRSVKRELGIVHIENSNSMEYSKRELTDCRKRLFENVKLSIEREKNEALKILKSIESQISDSRRNLDRINSSCLNGESEISEKKKEIANLNRKIEELANIIIKTEEAEERLKLLEIEEKRIKNIIIEASNASDAYIAAAREQIAALRNEAQVIVSQKEHAEYSLKTYTDQLYTAMNDWQIIRSRLEDRWKQTFPELEIPLSM